MQLTQIGIIHSPYKEKGQAPRQGRLSQEEMTLEIFPDYAPALKNLDQLTHVIVLYWGDRADRSTLQSPTPFSREPVGVFSSRSPNRPNPIAFNIAELLDVQESALIVRGLDALDGSPLLDIKAYSPAIDSLPEAKSNWNPPLVENPFPAKKEQDKAHD